MNVEIRQYEKGDELLIDETLEDRPVDKADYWRIWRENVLPEYTWTMMVGNKVIAIGGFWPYGNQNESVIVWLTVAQNAPAKLSLVRAIKAQIDELLKHYKRVEAIIFDNFFLGPRWMEFLGFQSQKRWVVNAIDCGAQIYVKESESGRFTANTLIDAGCDDNCVGDLVLS